MKAQDKWRSVHKTMDNEPFKEVDNFQFWKPGSSDDEFLFNMYTRSTKENSMVFILKFSRDEILSLRDELTELLTNSNK